MKMNKLKLFTNIFMSIAITTIASTCFASSTEHSTKYIIRGSSMAPTLKTNCVYDAVYTVPTSTYEINRNDIITFNRKNSQIIKRVIGLPGDVIVALGKREGYIRNGHRVYESFICDQNYKYDECPQPKTYVVPENCLFVLGDNREVSYDSSDYDYPFINIKDVNSKIVKMTFSRVAD